MKADTVVADYRGHVPCKCCGYVVLYLDCRGSRLPQQLEVKMPRFLIAVPRLPWFSLTAEACRANAVISGYYTGTSVVFAYCGSVPCKYRNCE